MDSELLERARLLQAAAGGMISLQKSIRVGENYSPGRSSPQRGPGESTLRGSVIRGSSLLTTFQDIRHKCPRGTSIEIDGVRCTVGAKGEYSASQISLAEDFPGQSNFDCVINVAVGENAAHKNVRVRTRAVAPVPSSEIFDAIRTLDDIDMIKTHMAQKAASKKEMPFQKGAPGRAQSLLRRVQYRPSQSGSTDDNTSSYAPSDSTRSKFKSRLPMAVRQARTYSDYDGTNRASSAPSRDDSSMMQQQQNTHDSKNTVTLRSAVANASTSHRGGSSSERPAYSYEHDEEVLHLGARDVAREREKALQRVTVKLREDRDKVERREQEEQCRREAARERSERKANVLMQKTLVRVEERKQRLAAEQRLRAEQEMQEQRGRARDEELAGSSAYSAKLQQIKQQTRQRLRGLKVLDRQMQAEKEAEAQRRLSDYTRLRSIPTKVLLGIPSESELPLLPQRLPRTQQADSDRYGSADQRTASLDADSVDEPWASLREPVAAGRTTNEAAEAGRTLVAAVAAAAAGDDDGSLSVDSMEQSPGKHSVSAETAYYLQDRPQSPLSDMTNLSPMNERRERKEKKRSEKKFKPWKLKPIPLSLPYIQLPAAASNSEFIV